MGNIECCKKPREENIDAEITAQKSDLHMNDISQQEEDKLKFPQPQENEGQQEYQAQDTFKPQDTNQKDYNEENIYYKSENQESKGNDKNEKQIYESFKQPIDQAQGGYDMPYDSIKEPQNYPEYSAQIQGQQAQNVEKYQGYQAEQPQEQIQYQQQEAQVTYPVEKMAPNFSQVPQTSYVQQPETQNSGVVQSNIPGYTQPTEQIFENFDPHQIQTRIVGTKQLSMDQVPKEIREKLFAGKSVTVEQHNATTSSNVSMPQYLPAEQPMQQYDFNNLEQYQKSYKVKEDELPPEIMAHLKKTIDNFDSAPQTQSINLAAKNIPGTTSGIAMNGLELQSNVFPSVVIPQNGYSKIPMVQSYNLPSNVQYSYVSSQKNQF